MSQTCVDIDECKTGDNTCHEKHAFCHNIVGGYQCECHEGFAGDGRSCDPIDHCNDPKLNECDLNAKCINTDGTYECNCNPGFRGTGRRCININECKERMHAKGSHILMFILEQKKTFQTLLKIVVFMLIAMIEMVTFIVNVLLDLKVMVKNAMILMNVLKVQAIEAV